MTDLYIYVIIALLPLTALMSVLQVNPYNALVIRGILGAVAVLVYAVLGAADVALTEALVGTLLAVSLYVIAVRSSLIMRLGIVRNQTDSDVEIELPVTTGLKIRKNLELEQNLGFIRKTLFKDFDIDKQNNFPEIITTIRKIIRKYYLRLELVEYPSIEALESALSSQDVHAICTQESKNNRILVRVNHLFEILQTDPNLSETVLVEYQPKLNMEVKH